MKKLTFLAVAAALSMAACTGGSKSGYTITGTVDGAANGDSVFIQEAANGNLVKIDTAIIKDGKFVFEGTQDSAVNRFVTYQPKNGNPMFLDFFLENGKININLNKENSTANGTQNNDTYQTIKNQIYDISKKMNELQKSLGDSTLTKEQRDAKTEEIKKMDESYTTIIKDNVKKNIATPVGVYMYKSTYYMNTLEENEALLKLIPAQYLKDEAIAKIQQSIDQQKKTAVGTKFIDFEMKTPDGKAIKLSDYVGKGKVVLVDFWASWCGPCRQEMPNLVDAYKMYKGKNFEIVGVSLDQTDKDWKDAIKKLNITWPQMSDLKFWNSEAAKLYAVSSIPHTILIDGQGTIIARGLQGEDLHKKLAEVLK